MVQDLYLRPFIVFLVIVEVCLLAGNAGTSGIECVGEGRKDNFKLDFSFFYWYYLLIAKNHTLCEVHLNQALLHQRAPFC